MSLRRGVSHSRRGGGEFTAGRVGRAVRVRLPKHRVSHSLDTRGEFGINEFHELLRVLLMKRGVAELL